MRTREILMLVLATLSGFIGGNLSGRLQSTKAAAEPQTLRASRFELVGEAGRTVAVLGRNQIGEAVLAFGGVGGRDRAVFGLHADRSPFLNLMGRDGRIRLTVSLGLADKPLLGMGDERQEGWVRLGFIGTDTPSAGPGPEDWRLLIRAPGVSGGSAGLGVAPDSKGTLSGWVAAQTGNGKQWSAPE